VGKLIYGVGVNDADYVIKVNETIGYVDGKRKRRQAWVCPFYQKWTHMLERGHSERFKLKNPTYKDVTVCKEWHLFSTFKSWMQEQDWEGKQLDKDLLVRENKVYNPSVCVFVSGQVNKFLTERGNDRGKYRIGACWHKATGKFIANCSSPFTGKVDHLGLFTNEDEAHRAWLAKKLEYAYALAEIQTDKRVAKALIDRYENWFDQSEREICVDICHA